jgi:pyridoxamine 5'-phosphate oxidase
MDPEQLFAEWFDTAVASDGEEAARCVVATCSLDGQPSARVVYHRPGPSGRLRFFTNYQSRKARELEENPRAAVVFHWQSLGRQVRLEGRFERVSQEQSDAYFAARTRASRLASTLSPQSRPIGSIAELRAEHARALSALGAADVPRPAGWGGYELLAERIEFWTAGDERLHERLLWTRQQVGWSCVVLAP